MAGEAGFEPAYHGVKVRCVYQPSPLPNAGRSGKNMQKPNLPYVCRKKHAWLCANSASFFLLPLQSLKPFVSGMRHMYDSTFIKPFRDLSVEENSARLEHLLHSLITLTE